MGFTISSLFSRLFSKKQMCILMAGLDAAGKTTILYKLKLGEIVTTIPIIVFIFLPCQKHFFFFFFLRYAGLSLLWPLPLQSTGSGRSGPAAMAHGPSRPAACGILPDRGTNPCRPHRQADSQQLHHQGSPKKTFFLQKEF
uniref:Uncharacterized protein n=1 Tax=Monodon monoceros TaxID=40151 RepID=A0A8C6BEH1_MONMO